METYKNTNLGLLLALPVFLVFSIEEDDSATLAHMCTLLLLKLVSELPRLLLPILKEATQGPLIQGSRPQPNSDLTILPPPSLAINLRVSLVSENPSSRVPPLIQEPLGTHAVIAPVDQASIGKVATPSFPPVPTGASPSMQGNSSHVVCMGIDLESGPLNPPLTLPSSNSETLASPSLVVPPATERLSYARAVANRNLDTISKESLQVMKPARKGLYLTVAVDETLYMEGVSELQDSLIGRILHVRGDKPLSHDTLVNRLGDVWEIKTSWFMTPLGEGYYNIRFSCSTDRERIYARRLRQIKPGLLRLQRWVPNFNPFRVNTSVVQAWIRISELPLEYWNKHIITALASAVGTVIKIDERTLNRTMGRFARVLMELDLKQERDESLMFEWAGHYSFSTSVYRNFANFVM
ncbi:hypothetical protein ACS0TY_022023 [Phlomoides rotata]